jgi:hypothetical protein
MSRLLLTFLVSAFLAANVAAFTSPSGRTSSSLNRLTTTTTTAPTAPFTTSAFESTTTTTTALNLKVKIDPEKAKNKNVAGNAKMAAYSGSIVIAILLPVIFLVWSALK